MYDYWPSPPVGTFILIDLLQPDMVSCAKHTRYRVGTYSGGTSFVFDEYNCNAGSSVWADTWYYMFDSGDQQVKEWRDDWVGDTGTFYSGKQITWGSTDMTPGVWLGEQTEKDQDGSNQWGWAQTRLNYMAKEIVLNGVSHRNAIYITNQQTSAEGAQTNAAYWLAPNTGGNGYGGFIQQQYYDQNWTMVGQHTISKTCTTTDFNQLACPP
jgi:hypothetical protein